MAQRHHTYSDTMKYHILTFMVVLGTILFCYPAHLLWISAACSTCDTHLICTTITKGNVLKTGQAYSHEAATGNEQDVGSGFEDQNSMKEYASVASGARQICQVIKPSSHPTVKQSHTSLHTLTQETAHHCMRTSLNLVQMTNENWNVCVVQKRCVVQAMTSCAKIQAC
jgi:hypothetical protein